MTLLKKYAGSGIKQGKIDIMMKCEYSWSLCDFCNIYLLNDVLMNDIPEISHPHLTCID